MHVVNRIYMAGGGGGGGENMKIFRGRNGPRVIFLPVKAASYTVIKR